MCTHGISSFVVANLHSLWGWVIPISFGFSGWVGWVGVKPGPPLAPNPTSIATGFPLMPYQSVQSWHPSNFGLLSDQVKLSEQYNPCSVRPRTVQEPPQHHGDDIWILKSSWYGLRIKRACWIIINSTSCCKCRIVLEHSCVEVWFFVNLYIFWMASLLNTDRNAPPKS